MSLRLPALGAFTIVLALTAVSAQHDQRTHGGQTSASQHQMPIEHLCGSLASAEGTPTSAQHLQHLASVLGLNAEQSVTVERATTELCVAMKKFHEQVHEVLTPEQRTKLRTLHGGGH